MTITINTEGDNITASLEGRLDTVASMQMEKDIRPLMDNADKAITLDFAKLEYICSSGLRLLLALRKKTIAKGGSVTIKNVNNDIRQVFNITGFVNLFTIDD